MTHSQFGARRPPRGETVPLERLETGIPGFDVVSGGGLPLARATLVTGTPGSAKTVFATQFLAEGITQYDQPGVFVTFEEPADDIRRNAASLGWPVADWEGAGKWVFVDCTLPPDETTAFVGDYDLAGLRARVAAAVERVGAHRIAVDSLSAAFARLPDRENLRLELARLSLELKRLGATPLVTAERDPDAPGSTHYSMEEFVADNVIVLRNQMEGEKRRRSLEILKMRGARHEKGQFPFTVASGRGVVVIPIVATRLSHPTSDVRTTTGVPELDRMCGNGFFRDAVILVAGATGTGKTLICTEFAAGGAAAGEKCLFISLEESRDQLFRNALHWGKDLPRMVEDGRVRVESLYPESTSLEELLVHIEDLLDEFKPARIVVDSLSAIERITSPRGFREFAVGVTSLLKGREITGLLTATTTSLAGGTTATEQHISTITDSIILLRYVEVLGEMRRGLMVLKMRGSAHDKSIREFTIDGRGLHIGKPFRNISGILSGGARFVPSSEAERIGHMFEGDNDSRGSGTP